MAVTTLSPTYYLTNFEALLSQVEERYSDLLTADELHFMTLFADLPMNARQLYVRLITRKGPRFRVDKLNYPEIDGLEEAVLELDTAGLLDVNPSTDALFSLDTLTKEELGAVLEQAEVAGIDGWKRADRETLLILLLNLGEDTLLDVMHEQWEFLEPCGRMEVFVFRTLFFGNTYQTLSDFVLEDVGALRYEPYELSRSGRFFDEREMLNQFLWLDELKPGYYRLLETGDEEVIQGGLEAICAAEENVLPPLINRYHRALAQIGHVLERMGWEEEAQRCYEMSTKPPARERACRQLERWGQDEEALKRVENLLEAEPTVEELEFAQRFRVKLLKKLGKPVEAIPRPKFRSEELVLIRDASMPIETQVLDHYRSIGCEAHYTENHLWKAVFGLVFWEVVFAPVDGVFFNAFQRGPTDLFTADFIRRRQQEVTACLEMFRNSKDYADQVLKRYDEKFKTANWLVDWKAVDRQMLQDALVWVPHQWWIYIFERMLDGLGELRTGFPDLLVNTGDGPVLVEVKGPGDQLRANQRRWLKFFEEQEVTYCVMKIKWGKNPDDSE